MLLGSFHGSVIGKQANGKHCDVDKEFKKLDKGEDRTPKPKSEDSSQVRQEVYQLKHENTSNQMIKGIITIGINNILISDVRSTYCWAEDGMQDRPCV